jgi:hypothetical protein
MVDKMGTLEQKEKFNQLKQGDRIEYILRANSIRDRHHGSSSYVLWIVEAFFLTFAFSLLLMIFFIQIYGVVFVRLFAYRIVALCKVFILLIILGIIFDCLDISRYRKEMEELNSEYFTIELKKKVIGNYRKWQRKR